MGGRIDIQNDRKDIQRQNQKKKRKSNRAKAYSALNCVYKMHAVPNIPLYVTAAFIKQHV
jgi:hypothetical protein